MRVSVIIPTHHSAATIADTLRSAAAQTLPAHEIIVIDDASTDDTLDRVRASGVPVTILHSTARNAAATRNVGIFAATGDWIAFLDADDLWYPNHLQRAADLLAHGDIAYRANYDEIAPDGRITELFLEQRKLFAQPTTQLRWQDYPALEMQGLPFGHSTVLMQRARVVEVGGFNATQRRRHDIDLWLRVIHGRTWCFDPIPSTAFRHSPGGISSYRASCEAFYLRAMCLNEPAYAPQAPQAMRQLLVTSAKRAMSFTTIDGKPEDRVMARQLAWPLLPWMFRLAYRAGGLCPPLLRAVLRRRRDRMTAAAAAGQFQRDARQPARGEA